MTQKQLAQLDHDIETLWADQNEKNKKKFLKIIDLINKK